MRRLLRWLRASTHTVQVVPVHPIAAGDDLVLSVGDLGASEDALALLDTVQQQFPACRIHLLVGFGRVVTQRQPGSEQSRSSTDQRADQPRLSELAAQATQAASDPGQQRNVVLLRHCAGGRIVAISIPPKQQGEAVEQRIVHAPQGSPAPAMVDAVAKAIRDRFGLAPASLNR